MKPVMSKVILATVMALWATACGAAATDTTSPPDTSPPDTTAPLEAASQLLHAVPGDATVVWGTAQCDFAEGGVDPDGGDGMAIECQFDMSDERVSGTERHDQFRFHVGRVGSGTVWVAEEATFTAAEGTWRGIAQAAEDPDALPIGEAHYMGEGTFEGLEFHYYFFDHPNLEDIQVHGWIYATP